MHLLLQDWATVIMVANAKGKAHILLVFDAYCENAESAYIVFLFLFIIVRMLESISAKFSLVSAF